VKRRPQAPPSAANELCHQEIARIQNAMVPTIAALRLMSPPALRGTAALMLERLGYKLLTLKQRPIF
jgi:hypothetical protein